MKTYADAVACEPSAPTPQFEPYEAMAIEVSPGCYSGVVVSSQGVPLWSGYYRWSDEAEARLEAGAVRLRMLARRQRLGEPFVVGMVR